MWLDVGRGHVKANALARNSDTNHALYRYTVQLIKYLNFLLGLFSNSRGEMMTTKQALLTIAVSYKIARTDNKVAYHVTGKRVYRYMAEYYSVMIAIVNEQIAIY